MRVIRVWRLESRPFPLVEVFVPASEGVAVGDVLAWSRDGVTLGHVRVRGLDFHGHPEADGGAHEVLAIDAPTAGAIDDGDELSAAPAEGADL